MNDIRLSLIAAAVLNLCVLVGCGSLSPPTIDATSKQSIHDSLVRMIDGMKDKEREQFEADLFTLTFSETHAQAWKDPAKAMKSMLDLQERTEVDLFKPLHGLNAVQIHAKAEEIRAKLDAA